MIRIIMQNLHFRSTNQPCMRCKDQNAYHIQHIFKAWCLFSVTQYNAIKLHIPTIYENKNNFPKHKKTTEKIQQKHDVY